MSSFPYTRSWVLLVGLALAGLGPAVAQDAGSERIDEPPYDTSTYGTPNPNAPEELSQFDFLIGKWNCAGKQKTEDGSYQQYQAVWTGRYILDGYVIADEFRIPGSNGQPYMLGQTLRSYDAANERWQMRWVDALQGTWTEVGSERLGGVDVGEDYVAFKTRVDETTIHRVRFSDITEDSFLWTADKSTDGGQTWEKAVSVVKATRITE